MKALGRSCSAMVARFEWRQTIDGHQVGFVVEPEINLLNSITVSNCLLWLNHIFEAARYKDSTFESDRDLELLSFNLSQRADSMVYFAEQSWSFR